VRGNAHIARADASTVIPILSEVSGVFGTRTRRSECAKERIVRVLVHRAR